MFQAIKNSSYKKSLIFYNSEIPAFSASLSENSTDFPAFQAPVM